MGSMSRYPVDSKTVGLVQHDKQKLYMFSVLWSDCNNILIYRTYDSFKDLSKLLTKKFPLEAGVVNKAERTLPILKDAPLLFRRKFSNRHLERLHLLEIYSKELLQADAKISQCEEVVQFFSPNKQDLTPSFPENSIVIMPSDNEQKQKEVPSAPSSPQPPTTQPIISEIYICIDAFETKDTKNRSFKVQKNHCIDVLFKDPTGWWLVENEEKCLAWFPAPYLRKSESFNDNNPKKKSLNKGMYYYAQKAYEAQQTDEISLTVGVVVEVIEKSETGWWLICYNGRFGYVPSMFLKPYNNPHHKLQVNQNYTLSGSTPDLSKVSSNQDTSPSPQHRIKEVRGNKSKLERMKSVSLNDLEDVSETSDETFVKSSRQRSAYVDGAIQDAEELTSSSMTRKPRSVQMKAYLHNWKDNMERGDHVEEVERSDSGFEEHLSPKISVSSDHADPTPPPVPQRPTMQEIQSRCTTITKKAALR
ncbi:NADPH oxidase organizer 1-like [Bufo bufo]|uniref:NADPH oxidase organizer 1-like n=1 Tax=Bufo bufo TaxID=8384 RepID=UPI001ABDD430|nr:NADPH oxidase organizer 1-like [Bufo bufo]